MQVASKEEKGNRFQVKKSDNSMKKVDERTPFKNTTTKT
jgi:hypothetical protein